MRLRLIGLPVAAAVLACAVAVANGQDGLAQPSKAAHAKLGRATPAAGPKAEPSGAAPCPRGTWKDDPVCFGEGEPDTLPTPSARSAASASSSGPTIKPTANINPRPLGPGPYQAGVVYQSNGNAVTSNYGGGVQMELPF